MLGQLVPEQQPPRKVADEVLLAHPTAVYATAADQRHRTGNGVHFPHVAQGVAQQLVIGVIARQQGHDAALWVIRRLQANDGGDRCLGADVDAVGTQVAFIAELTGAGRLAALLVGRFE
ncbi:hypothetical protein D3C84_1019930 [compost metagenome]